MLDDRSKLLIRIHLIGSDCATQSSLKALIIRQDSEELCTHTHTLFASSEWLPLDLLELLLFAANSLPESVDTNMLRMRLMRFSWWLTKGNTLRCCAACKVIDWMPAS